MRPLARKILIGLILLVLFLTVTFQGWYPDRGWLAAFNEASQLVGIWVVIVLLGYALMNAKLKEW